LTYTPTPDDRHSILITKSFSYRGRTQLWTNRYHFEGDLPPDATHWQTFADAIVAAEKLALLPSVEIVLATGYDSSTATLTNLHGDAVWSAPYSVAGTHSAGTGEEPAPGDCAALVRYATPARSVRNHPVYLFNYYHGVLLPNGGGDSLTTGQKTLLGNYAAAWIAGFSDGAETHERCGPHGAVAIGSSVNDFVRHRDFPN
jgi:hypothetical protein